MGSAFRRTTHYTARVSQITRSYTRVLITWVVVLAALFALQEFFG